MLFPSPLEPPAGEIQYHYQDIGFRLEDTSILDQWIKGVIEVENQELDTISYIFCSDEYLHSINVQYLNHDTYTDIITFPLSDVYIESDIYVSIDRIMDNALQMGTSFKEELRRVMIHGILHLCGYADKSPEDQDLMTQKENEALNRYTTLTKQ